MSYLLALGASLLVVPQVTLPSERAIQQAYPQRALKERLSGAVFVRISVDPLGRVFRCEPLRVIGDAIFKDAVCQTHRRWKFSAAHTANGTPTHAVLTTLIKYHLMDKAGLRIRALAEPADLKLMVARRPGKTDKPFEIAIEVHTDGNVTHCEGMNGTAEALAISACAAAKAHPRPIATDVDGNPVPYVEPLLVQSEASSLQTE